MSRKSPPELAYIYLKSAILDLQFRPQAPLRTQTIASELGLSRTPVREALSRLEQEGLVVRIDRRGYVVRSMTMKEAMDIYEIRELLEVRAVREAVRRVRYADVKAMERSLCRAETYLKQRKIKECRDQIRACNLTIARAAGNSYLADMLSSMADRIRWLGSMINDKHKTRFLESIRMHEEILKAIRGRDADAAESATKALIAGARNGFIEYVMSGDTKGQREVATFPVLAYYVH